jgi:hypothetical protein
MFVILGATASLETVALELETRQILKERTWKVGPVLGKISFLISLTPKQT